MVSDACKSLEKDFLFFYHMEQIHESLKYPNPYEIDLKERLNQKPVQADFMH